jgi:hypothetical protein
MTVSALLSNAVWKFTDVSVAAPTSKTSANFYQNTRRSNPEGSHLHIYCYDNLRSHYIQTLFKTVI